MKTLRILFSLALFWPAVQAARAQSAGEFFNGGAQFYISNNVADAWKKVEAGRKLYPDDEKLKKLEELLKQQQQQQQQQQQDKQNQSQKSQNSQNQPSQGKQNQEQNRQNAQKQQQNQQSQQSQNNAQKEKSSSQAQQAQAMTPGEAKRLLDSQKGNEQILTYKPPNQPENQNSPIKDW
jgi:hypothetical protein